jgi:DNA topoisomerase I
VDQLFAREMSASDDDDLPLSSVRSSAKRSHADEQDGDAVPRKRLKLRSRSEAKRGSEKHVGLGKVKDEMRLANGSNAARGKIGTMKREPDGDLNGNDRRITHVEKKPRSSAVSASGPASSRVKKARSNEKSKTSPSPLANPVRVESIRGAKSEILRVRGKERKVNGRGINGEENSRDGVSGCNGPEEDDSEAQCWWEAEGNANGGIKWKTLSHNAVLFPPEYVPHNIPLLYDGGPVDLVPRCEEIATFFAAKLDTEYVSKKTFRDNFFTDFRASLTGTPACRIIASLDKCDFSRIKAHLDRKRDEKKELSSAERKALKEAESVATKKYVYAIVDGREEKVGNYRVEPPGLFLGRGEHPRMGQVKARIYPEDITINIGSGSHVPEVPVLGHKWGKIVHDNKVTWLAGWKDSITGGRKYVFLSAGSQFKGMSDREKFEKARALGRNIDAIRRDYRAGWSAKSKEVRQRSVAMYLIDKLALRVGNEKNEDEADTVGCCSLRVEHIKLIPPVTVEFDFLGKDSMRYHNRVDVESQVFDNLSLFMRNKNPIDGIFHRLTVAGLNEYLRSLMPGLSAKVFRTYNASITLDALLRSTGSEMSMIDKVVYYNQQNKEVAILCNHQRSTPKGHESQMSRLSTRIQGIEEWLTELQKAQRKLSAARKKGDSTASMDVTEYKNVKPEYTEHMDDKAKAAEKKRAAEAPRVKCTRTMTLAQVDGNISRTKQNLNKLRADMTVKDDLKTVALGTSKINYLDPRITVAWCKKHDVPIERMFAAALLVKFAWAMPTPSTFSF